MKNIDDSLKTIRMTSAKKFCYGNDSTEIYINPQIMDAIDFCIDNTRRLLEEQRAEIVEEICDGLVHLPIHGDMDLMAEEIRDFKKEIYNRYLITKL